MPQPPCTPEYVAGYIQSRMHELEHHKAFLEEYSELTLCELCRTAGEIQENHVRIHEQIKYVRRHPLYQELMPRMADYEKTFQQAYRKVKSRIRKREEYELSTPVNMASGPRDASMLYSNIDKPEAVRSLDVRYVATDESSLSSTDEENTGRSTPPAEGKKKTKGRKKKSRPMDLDPYDTDGPPVPLEHMSIMWTAQDGLGPDDLRYRINEKSWQKSEHEPSSVSMFATPATSQCATVSMVRHSPIVAPENDAETNASLRPNVQNTVASIQRGRDRIRTNEKSDVSKDQRGLVQLTRERSRSKRTDSSHRAQPKSVLVREDGQRPSTSGQKQVVARQSSNSTHHESPKPHRNESNQWKPRQRYIAKQQFVLPLDGYEGPLPPRLNYCPRNLERHDHSLIGLSEIYVIRRINYHECPRCRGDHKLYRCEEFTTQPLQWRWWYVLTMGLCLYCLTEGHSHFRCRSVDEDGHNECPRCWIRHNSLLCPVGQNK